MTDIFRKKNEELVTDFNSIRLNIASPEMIREWSWGEVKKPETINYRTFKPEKDGLFCERIFGPVNDWECNCGKYKRMKSRGIVCDRCGVEVTQSKVRRERMGHIELASMVSHIWFYKGLPSYIGCLLDLSVTDLGRIIYYDDFIVIDSGDTPLQERKLLSEEEFREYTEKYGDRFTAKMGADAIYDLLVRIDLPKLSRELRDDLSTCTSTQKEKKLIKRLKVVEAFRKSGNNTEWVILSVVPVIPPELRPLVPLDGGRFATSDLNDLYRRVINRNNRLKKLKELKAPDVIIRNEKRMLQEAVDALFDNGRRGRTVKGRGNRPLKSLSNMLKGKQGRFRQNLLGKRVDYSGRSVIVIGPELKLHQCGLPKKMALELFKPFIIKKLDEKGFVSTIKGAKKMVEDVRPEVWDILEEVIKDHPVMLNRAPTLHRLGIQAFMPVLVEGNAIRIHPLVCTAFNADFDGDQMAVHVPLSREAINECKRLMMPPQNILSSANGKPVTTPTQDIILGCNYLSKSLKGIKGEGMIFADFHEALLAHDLGHADLHALVKVRHEGEIIQTTVGRIIFNEILPPSIPFFNKEINRKVLVLLVSDCHSRLGEIVTSEFLDKLKKIGFHYATLAGVTIGINDMLIPKEKTKLISEARAKVVKFDEQYKKGVITDGERHNKTIDIWTHVTEQIAEKMFDGLADEMMIKKRREKETVICRGKKVFPRFNPIYTMANSGARGSKQQIRQLAGMRGLMAKPSGEIIEAPIIANFREGLTVLEYFISTHGARKGLADTALKTADSGYLTRRLVDVGQDVIVSMEDCGTVQGILIGAIMEGEEVIEPLSERILGRVALDNVVDLLTDNLIVKAGEEIDEEKARTIEESGIERLRIRSVLTCEAKRGVCRKCYGRDLTSGKMIEQGEAVGVIAAQSIGEPGTQLTMRTFHIGGTASRVVEQSHIEVRNAGKVHYNKNLKTLVRSDGCVIVTTRMGTLSILNENEREVESYNVYYGTEIMKKDGDSISKGEELVKWDAYNRSIISEIDGTLKFVDIVDGMTMREEVDTVTGLKERVIVPYKEEGLRPRILVKQGEREESYLIPIGAHLGQMDGAEVKAGEMLAKIPREIGKTKDITGGLPRVAELFEARKPKEHAIITEIDGVVRIAGYAKGMCQLVVQNPNGIEKEYLVPQGKHLNVRNGDAVVAGEALMDGALNPHDILRVMGVRALQEYLVNEVQEVYRLQGVDINDKHIEIVVRQMLRKVRVESAGDTIFLAGEEVDRFCFQEENDRVLAEGKTPAVGKPILLGITKASLRTESFISAASFQETTRVLADAAIRGKRDHLRGLQENVIIGHLIPAGTGYNCDPKRAGEDSE